MTKEKSKTTARTIGNNHEWGISMITPMLNHYKSAFDEYIKKDYSDKNASNQALADTIVYMPHSNTIQFVLCRHRISSSNRFSLLNPSWTFGIIAMDVRTLKKGILLR